MFLSTLFLRSLSQRITRPARACSLGATLFAASFAASGIQSPLGAAESPRDIVRAFSDAFADIVAEVSPAVVTLEVTGKPRQSSSSIPPQLRRFFGPSQPQPAPRGQGSGFIVNGPDDKPVIITNHHVIDNAAEISINLVDGRKLSGTVIGSDPMTDLAVVAVVGDHDLPRITLASDEQRVGEWVLAIGSPFGLRHTVTAGIISAIDRNDLRVNAFENFIQTDAAINQGNSGGPLVNLDGEVIGINSAILSRSGGSNGIGLAIPVELAKPIINQLINNGVVQRGFVGIGGQDVDEELAEALGLANTGGVIVNEVVSDSGAAAAGIEIQDVITAINGQPIEDWAAFRLQVATLQPGTELTLTVFRDGSDRDINVTLGSRPGEAVAVNQQAINKEIGLDLQPLTKDIRQQQELPDGLQGAIVSAVTADSPAYKAGIRRGMVLTAVGAKVIDSPAKAGRALAAVKPGTRVPLRVYAGGGYRFVTLLMPE